MTKNASTLSTFKYIHRSSLPCEYISDFVFNANTLDKLTSTGQCLFFAKFNFTFLSQTSFIIICFQKAQGHDQKQTAHSTYSERVLVIFLATAPSMIACVCSIFLALP